MCPGLSQPVSMPWPARLRRTARCPRSSMPRSRWTSPSSSPASRCEVAMVQRLEGKTALVTGGAGGIGLAIAHRFAREGAHVIIADIDPTAGERARVEAPGLAFRQLDVTDDRAWQRVVDGVAAQHGGLDILVNNAGVIAIASIETITLETWRRVQSVNVDGTFLGCRHGVRVMKDRGGAILNMSSVSGIVGGHNLVAYTPQKGRFACSPSRSRCTVRVRAMAFVATRFTPALSRPECSRTSRPLRAGAIRRSCARSCAPACHSGATPSRTRLLRSLSIWHR